MRAFSSRPGPRLRTPIPPPLTRVFRPGNHGPGNAPCGGPGWPGRQLLGSTLPRPSSPDTQDGTPATG
eukprot:13988572-Heterocapsa_arctica.AAC.1